MTIQTDTDVLINALRCHPPSVSLLDSLVDKHVVVVNLLPEMEIVQGCRNKGELITAQRFVRRFEIITPDLNEMNTARNLLSAHRLQHGLSIPDAIIAATAVVRKLPLLSHNRKHFRAIHGLEFYQPQD